MKKCLVLTLSLMVTNAAFAHYHPHWEVLKNFFHRAPRCHNVSSQPEVLMNCEVKNNEMAEDAMQHDYVERFRMIRLPNPF